ncbi:LacI family transcriptional regulator [Streptomyces sp. WAC 06738]|nr:LacI family transcriptional regulator [Streptomyces sp. WAC 06738]
MARPVIADVAARAGVSRTTVSHALSGKRPVSPRVLKRVQEAMAELGYVPRRAAQTLKSGASQIVGLIVPDISNTFFADLAKGVEDVSLDQGYNVVFGNTAFEVERERFHLNMIRSQAVDGVVYAAGAPSPAPDTAEMLAGIPFVLVDEEVPGIGATSVVSDNAEGGRLAARHLAALNHRDALVLSASSQLMSSLRRVEGFRDLWLETGGSCEVRPGGFTYDGGYAAIREAAVLFLERGFTCVFAVNDMMALGAVAALRDLGLAIPADVSVVGFDDVLAAHLIEPALTTVRQDAAVLGRTAAEELYRIIADPASGPEHTVLPVTLRERHSTAPAAARRPAGRRRAPGRTRE